MQCLFSNQHILGNYNIEEHKLVQWDLIKIMIQSSMYRIFVLLEPPFIHNEQLYTYTANSNLNQMVLYNKQLFITIIVKCAQTWGLSTNSPYM